MLCKKCGAQIPDNSSKCEFCGENLIEDTKVIEIEEYDSEENDFDDAVEVGAAAAAGYSDDEIFDDNERRRRKQVQKMMEDKKHQLSEIERRRDEKRQKQKRNRIMLIAAICALAIAASGIGAYYVAQNINPDPVVTTTPAPTALTTVATIAPVSTGLVEVSPTPGLSMAVSTAAPSTGTTSSTTDGQSWTATNSSGSASGSSSNRGTSSSGSTSSASSNSGSGSSSSANTGSSSSNKGTASSSGGSTSGSSTSVAAATNSGVVTNNFAAQLVTGGEVIYNTGTGRYLMTFVSGGKKYYATVSEGSTTEQIKNKKYTVSATPTKETYNGNTVYDISSLTGYAEGDYILPDSGTRLLTANDLKGLSKHDLALARNEIYARHGRKFQTEAYSKYFSSKSWYKINPNYDYSDDESNLNEIEQKNVDFILEAERR